MKTAEERFWSKVTKADGNACWEWQGARQQGGTYGVFWFQGKMVGAHRFSYLVATGSDPGDMEVCHTCDNPGCVRPSHLFAGTAKDNAADRQRKGRGRDQRGSKNSMSKLTGRVDDMRAMYGAGATYQQVADTFDVSLSTAYEAVRGVTWKGE